MEQELYRVTLVRGDGSRNTLPGRFSKSLADETRTFFMSQGYADVLIEPAGYGDIHNEPLPPGGWTRHFHEWLVRDWAVPNKAPSPDRLGGPGKIK